MEERRKQIFYNLGEAKSHKGVSKDTISRWIRAIRTNAGIDMNVFKQHSTRSAATSKALQLCVPIQDVLKQAGWSNQRTFGRFYNKPVNRCLGLQRLFSEYSNSMNTTHVLYQLRYINKVVSCHSLSTLM